MVPTIIPDQGLAMRIPSHDFYACTAPRLDPHGPIRELFEHVLLLELETRIGAGQSATFEH